MRRSNQLSYEATDSPIVPNPENNGLHSVCSLHFVLSSNLYIKGQQDMDIFIFFQKNNTSSGKPGIGLIKRNTTF